LAQWESWREERRSPPKVKPAPVSSASSAKPKKRSYKDQLEFDSMEGRIRTAEAELARLTNEAGQNASNAPLLTELTAKIETQMRLVEGLYARWAELERN
jgi:ATP-binding cassette subfamily F protein uup